MMLSSRSVSPSRRVRRTSRPPQLGHSGTLGMLRDCGERPRSRNEPNALSFRGDLRIGRADADSENMTPEIARDLYGLTIPATSTVPRSVAGRRHRCQVLRKRAGPPRAVGWTRGALGASAARTPPVSMSGLRQALLGPPTDRARPRGHQKGCRASPASRLARLGQLLASGQAKRERREAGPLHHA